MSAIFVLILLGFLVALGFLLACIWAIRNGQFEDGYTPALRILFEEKHSDTQKNKR